MPYTRESTGAYQNFQCNLKPLDFEHLHHILRRKYFTHTHFKIFKNHFKSNNIVYLDCNRSKKYHHDSTLKFKITKKVCVQRSSISSPRHLANEIV